jgi:threonylcarbamoyladenosine tRNA methylthiotransferase MtaB
LLRSLSVQLKRKFYKSQLGNTKDVLFETENRNGFIYGFSNNYVRIKTAWRKSLADQIVSFDLEDIDNDGLVIGKNTELKTIV